MAVELMGFPQMGEQKAIEEAAAEGLKGMEHLLRLLSKTKPQTSEEAKTKKTIIRNQNLTHTSQFTYKT